MVAAIMVSERDCSSSSCNWSIQLKRSRSIREALLSSDNETIQLENGKEFLNHFRSVKESICDEVRLCCSANAAHHQNKQHRLALRVALCCLSIPPENHCHDELRRTVQQESYDCWNITLLTLILNKEVDESCRLLAAQVLCNTITDCPPNALHIMEKLLPAPSDGAIAQKIRNDVLFDDATTDTAVSDSLRRSSPLLESTTILSDTSWVDFILASTSSRSLLAVVVACLHNSICAVTKCTTNATPTDQEQNSFDNIIYEIARSTLLISTLLRHIVAAVSVQSSRNGAATIHSNSSTTTTDEATEWIMLLLSKLCRLGLLTVMYKSIAGGKDDRCQVYPEHIVLLHTVRTLMEESKGTHVDFAGRNSIDVDEKSRCYYLGGDKRIENSQAMIDAQVFLVGLYVALSSALSKTPTDSSDHDTLHASALQLVLDILAESLSEDSFISDRIRHILGSKTTILQSIVSDLASILDLWHAHNKTLYARDQIKMNEIDQCRITTSVRVIGNLCFHCRQNQDLLRSIKVSNKHSKSEKLERNGLHVLLSTTSMSYVCFTLREWAVVAIRSVLEDCPENQAIVSELEGQSALQTADLDEMGIRVNLNVPTGTVTVDQLLDK
jgi:ataxin-10